MDQFSHLFQPGSIGTLQLKNRLILPAMGIPLAEFDGQVTDQMITFYRVRAEGGVGLVTTSFASVSSDAAFPMTLSIHDDQYIPGLTKLVNTVHQAGSKVCIQLMHPGMLFLFAGYIPEGMSIKTPSITSLLRNDVPFEEVSREDIDRYIEDFTEAARRVRNSGADAVELHASNGCLVSTFMSPITNRREDEYGGSIENRARFAKQIVERMKEKVGAEFPVIVRINVTDDMEGGVTSEEVIQQAIIMESAGADSINISSGMEYWTTSTIPCYQFPDGSMADMAAQIKKAVSIPVISAGKIGPELGEQLLTEGKADYIALGRPLLADPELPNKIRDGAAEDVWKCVYCNNCVGVAADLFPGSCSANPFAFREDSYPLSKVDTPKNVMVIGGGLAGMRMALLLAQKGHDVALYERSHKLGGQWNVACATLGKEEYAPLVEHLSRSLKDHNVKVVLNTEVTRQLVQEIKPDAAIVATGAVPIGLNIPGASLKHVVQGHDVLAGTAEVKGRTVIVGGRFIGMEVAITLAEQGKDLCLVTQAGLGENGIKLEQMTFRTLARKLLNLRVPLYLHTKVLEITEKAAIISLGNEIYSLDADTVVLAVGMRSENKLMQELMNVIPELHSVGDCVQPRDAAAVAVHTGQLAQII